MNQVLKLAKREFRGYFDQATAYILVVAFLALGLFLTFRSLYAAGIASMRPFFDILPWLFAVFVPAITMRSFAEERRSGTIEWLMSQPLDEFEVTIGKFLGNWTFTLVALAGTLPLALGLLLVSEADPGIMLAQYIGAGLLSGLLVAVGMFASAATKNQITAFILSVAISFVLVLAGLHFTLVGLPPSVAAVVGDLSIMRHYGSIERGVLDLRDVLYFVLTATLFLGLAYFLLTRQRLSPKRGAYRRLRYGIASVAGLVVVLNLLGGHIHGRLDLTSENLYTLSEGTHQVVGSLDDLVTVKLFVSNELPPRVQLTLRDVRDVLSDYERISDGRLRVVELNPDESEEAADEARSLGIRQIQFNVLSGDEISIKRGWLGLAILYAGERKTIPVIARTGNLEYQLTSRIAALTADSKPRLAFLTGFGASGAMAHPALREMLGDRYAVESVNIDVDSAAAMASLDPDSFDVIVLAAPTQPLSGNATALIDDYLDAGGSGLFLIERHQIRPRSPVAGVLTTGLASVLGSRGISIESTLAFDMASNQRVSLGRRGRFNYVAPYPLWPIAVPAGEHTITRGLDRLTLAWASPLEVTDSARVIPLWSTTEYGGTRPGRSPISPNMMQFEPDPETLGRQVLAAAVLPVGAGDAAATSESVPQDEEEASARNEADPSAADNGEGSTRAEGDAPARAEGANAGGRLVVIGDGDFLSRRFARSNPQNAVFAANAIDWLAQGAALIAIRSKDRSPPPLLLDGEVQQAVLKWGNMIGIPLLFIAFGAVRVMRRRRLSALSWEETVA